MESMTEERIETEVVQIARRARMVASVLDALPDEVETPTHFDIDRNSPVPGIKWLIFGSGQENQRERAAAIIRSVGGHWKKFPGDLFRFDTEIKGVKISVVVARTAVCQRVVTGTREVVMTVPAPNAPTVEITETVEDVEWVCSPLLSEATS